MTEQTLPISLVIADPNLQARVELNEEAIERYAEAYTAGERLPRLSVVSDGERYWLVDGWHRRQALLKVEAAEVEVEITEGDWNDAALLAAKANATHGVRRTHADSEVILRLALTALLNKGWTGLSGAVLARETGLSEKTVSRRLPAVLDADRELALSYDRARSTRSRRTAEGMADRTALIDESRPLGGKTRTFEECETVIEQGLNELEKGGKSLGLSRDDFMDMICAHILGEVALGEGTQQ